MVKNTIQIFARVKPTRSKTGPYEIDEDDEGTPRLTFTVPRELADGFINNKRENYKFRFQQVFDQKTKQDEIFDAVAKPVMDNVLEGYNGTIFAYGQTGSGKTFTITGGPEHYKDRGIIPRTISYIFEQFEKNPDTDFSLHVSYLEIYNESGYDLLDPKHDAAKLEDLPKVSLLEDSDQNIHLKNLSVHQASNEEEALNLLFLGDTNRMIAETPMNQASTRSHCIFTIHVMSREPGSATIRRSKLHLVDLAGSERVSKTGVNGQLLKEAKYINLSLHFLEQVIISLSDKGRQHIPYRNSMMTSVLRDSLGGNCMTTMIATCSVEKKNLDESISTCRFSQRVAMVKNEAILNEELDPKLMIAKLKREIQQLKEELAMATGEQRTDDLTSEEIDRCKDAVEDYLADTDTDASLNVGADMRKIQLCYKLLKRTILEKPSRPVDTSPSREAREPVDTSPYNSAEVNKLKDLILQRDNEINILVNMLKKEKKRAADAMSQLNRLGHSPRRHSSAEENQNINGHQPNTPRAYTGESMKSNQPSRDSQRLDSSGRQMQAKENNTEERAKRKILGDMSMGRQEAFEIFRRDYNLNKTIEEQKQTLKQRYLEAKTLGEVVNQTRASINHIKGQIEHHRMSMAMKGLMDSNNPEPDDTEIQLRADIEQEKARYKETFNKLRVLKTEIEHLQHFMEKSKVKLMKDFELWWAEQMTVGIQSGQSLVNSDKTKAAWRTPPVTPPTRGQISTSSSQSSLSSKGDNSGNGWSSFPSKHPVPDIVKSSHVTQGSSDRFNNHKISNHGSSGNIPLTGDPRADADIMAFVKARQNIIQQAQGPR